MEASSRRQIVVCCDGTNNTLTGGAEDTNVLQLHRHLVSQAAKEGCERILYYDPGVGSPGVLPPAGPTEWFSRTWKRATGLASGSGVFENVADAYVFLMRHWRDHDDRIYLFGFSRGAFTVRAVAGMVNLFGIVRPEYEELVPTLVHIYFAPAGQARANPLQRATRALHRELVQPRTGAQRGNASALPDMDQRDRLAEQVRSEFAGPGRRDAWVHWIGVWDTVESVGLPGPLSRVNPTPPTFVGKRYRHVRHALSLDEHRWPFLPRLYEEPNDVPAPGDDRLEAAPQTLKQRWYPGVHCDIGGGYPRTETGLSQAALRWMVEEMAPDLGIAPIPADPQAVAWRHDPLWDTPFWALAGMTVRDLRQEEGGRAGSGRVRFEAIPATNLPPPPIRSVWELRRSAWPVLGAIVLGFLFLVLSGICLLGASEAILPQDLPLRAAQAARDFAQQQLAAVWLQGLFAAGHRPWQLGLQPGWAMFWDLAFIGCWAYLLARVSSRAFAWLVGERSVHSTRPWWLAIGFAPCLAVAGDVAEDLCLWLGLALHWAGTDIGALLFVWLGGVAALCKFAGLAACVVLVAVRCLIVLKPGPLHGPEAHLAEEQ